MRRQRIKLTGPAAGGDPAVRTLSLAVPVADTLGYPVRHLELQLTPREAGTLQAVRAGLVAGPTRLADGRFVQRPPDVVRWLLERSAAA